MLVVETIAKIRRAYFQNKKPIKQICRELRVSRNTVRKVIRSGATEHTYERTVQPQPKIGPWKDKLDEMLAVNARKPKRERLTRIRIFEELRALGYDGGYDAVRRYAASWSKEEQEASAAAYVPLIFDPGEAYQFDWSYEIVVIDGATTTVKVAHIRLCHSRMLFVRAYPRETQEMVFDAHDKAFAFFDGACARGIYDSEVWPPWVRGQAERRPRWTRSSSAVTAPTTAVSSRCAGTTLSILLPAPPRQAGRRGRSRTRSALSGDASSCPGPSSRATPNSMPGSRIAALPGPSPIRTRSFGIKRSGKCSKTSARAWCPTSARSTIARQAIAKQSAGRGFPFRSGVSLEDLPRPLRQEPVLGGWPRRRPARRDPRLCRAGRVLAGRQDRGTARPCLRARQGDLRPAALYPGAGPQARSAQEWCALQGLGTAISDQAHSAQAWQGAEWRPADGPDPEHDPNRWAECSGGCLCRSAERRGPRGLGRHQHPGPTS